MDSFNPFRLHTSHAPLPVEGETHPPIRLVEEELEPLEHSRPLWVRLSTVALMLFFVVTTLLSISGLTLHPAFVRHPVPQSP